MIDRIKNRMAGEQGFTLIELLVVIVILGVLVAIAVPAYLSFRGKAQTAAGESNVRAGIPAAESYYQTNNMSYSGISSSTLSNEAKGLSPNLKAVALNSGKGYCIQDSEDGGTTFFSYAGGDTTGATYPTGKKASTIQAGDCATDTGASGAA